MSAARRLPAYARDLANARALGYTLADRTVSVALSWRRRPIIGYGVVVGDDEAPEQMDWTWVRGLEVLLWRREESDDRVRAAAHAIRLALPRRLVIVDVRDSRIISLLPDGTDGRRAA